MCASLHLNQLAEDPLHARLREFGCCFALLGGKGPVVGNGFRSNWRAMAEPRAAGGVLAKSREPDGSGLNDEMRPLGWSSEA